MLCKHCADSQSVGFFLQHPWIHCHHEEKPKDKCWCGFSGTSYNVQRYSIGKDSGGVTGWYSPTFCPDCGRKLK